MKAYKTLKNAIKWSNRYTGRKYSSHKNTEIYYIYSADMYYRADFAAERDWCDRHGYLVAAWNVQRECVCECELIKAVSRD